MTVRSEILRLPVDYVWDHRWWVLIKTYKGQKSFLFFWKMANKIKYLFIIWLRQKSPKCISQKSILEWKMIEVWEIKVLIHGSCLLTHFAFVEWLKVFASAQSLVTKVGRAVKVNGLKFAYEIPKLKFWFIW